MNHPNLNQILRQLRLSGLLQTLPVRLQEAAASRLSHAEFLELIFQDEVAVRQERLLSRRTKAADIPWWEEVENSGVDWHTVGRTDLAYSPEKLRQGLLEWSERIPKSILIPQITENEIRQHIGLIDALAGARSRIARMLRGGNPREKFHGGCAQTPNPASISRSHDHWDRRFASRHHLLASPAGKTRPSLRGARDDVRAFNPTHRRLIRTVYHFFRQERSSVRFKPDTWKFLPADSPISRIFCWK